MKRGILIYIVIIVVLIIMLLFNFFTFRVNIRYLKGQIRDNTSLVEEVLTKQRKTFKYNGEILMNQLIYDNNGTTYDLKSIVHKKIVIFNFSVTNCSQCYEPILKLLEFYQGNDLIIIYHANNIRDLNFLIKKYQFKFKVYYSSINYKSFPSETENLPCFFNLNRNLELNNIYYPLKNDINTIREYLKQTLKKL